MAKPRIALIQVWLGELPKYFEYHYQTCVNLNIDFFFFTDQVIDSKYRAPNFKFIKITKRSIEFLILAKTKKDIRLASNYKITELKPAYADLFQSYVANYEYVGWYDIDTLFGDVVRLVTPYLGTYDIISFGEDNSPYDRISGPLGIAKNTKEVRTVYLNDDNFYRCMDIKEYSNYDEDIITQTYRELGLKLFLFNNSCNLEKPSFKIIFDAKWVGGRIYVNGEEKLIYHFYRKSDTTFYKIGNTIIANQNIKYLDDFYYVTYFTENYEEMASVLIRSLSKYSNRRCLLYTVNYTSTFENTLSDQFIVRRIDLDDITLDNDFTNKKGQSFSVITSKPIIQADSLNVLPNKKFVFLDTDIYVTANIDSIKNEFKNLENYPIANSHVHDVIYWTLDGTTVSSLHQLGEEAGIDIKIFPRRKTNVILYDERSKWFFIEQMKIYNNYKDSDKLGIFGLHDEDTFNLILSQHNFTKCLPVIDIEETFDLDLTKYTEYSYSVSNTSALASIPKTDRDILVFHGGRTADVFDKINNRYGCMVLDHADILINYDGRDLKLERNSLLINKKIKNLVRITVSDEMLRYSTTWPIFEYATFYIWNAILGNGKLYTIELSDVDTNRLIFRQDFVPNYN